VLDFVGIFENLEKALAFDSQDVKGVVEGIDVLKGRFGELIERGRADFLPITAGKFGDKAVEALLEHFRDKERRQAYYQFFRELEEVYEILSPDPFLRPFIDDYTEFGRMYRLLRECYDRGAPVDKDFLRKTAKLVQEHTETGTIQAPDKIHRLDTQTLEQIAGADKPATVKVFNLLKALHDIVERDARQEPYLVSIGDKAEQIAAAFEERQETTQKTLDELEKLLAELRQAQAKRAETELSPEAFAVYWLLDREGVANAQDVAQAAAAAFAEHPHWQTSSHQEQAVRKSLYKAMIIAGIQGVVDLAQRVMKMLRRTP
jgi:type I restriction enzyme R subunit